MAKRKPRQVPSRHERYMGLAFWIASFSKDPDTQVGALIISDKNTPLGYGYNGPPSNMLDIDVDWRRTEKYPFIRTAVANAITFSHRPLEDAILYVTAPICPTCILDIIAEKIKKVIYFPLKRDKESSLRFSEKNAEKTEKIAKNGKVDLIKFDGNLNWMRDRINEMNLLGVFG
jgi:dCMP deaminase